MQGDILQILAKPLMYVIAAASYSRIVLWNAESSLSWLENTKCFLYKVLNFQEVCLFVGTKCPCNARNSICDDFDLVGVFNENTKKTSLLLLKV